MEPEGSLPHSHVITTCPYPKPARSIPCSTPHFLKIHPNIIFPSRLGLPSCLLPSGFPTKTLYTPLPSPIHTTCPTHLIILDFIMQEILGKQYRSLSSSLCSFLHSIVTSSPLRTSILLNTVFSDTISLRFCLILKDKALYPYKTTGKIIVLRTLHTFHW